MGRKGDDPKVYRRPNGVYYTEGYRADGTRYQRTTNQRTEQAALVRARVIRRSELVQTAPRAAKKVTLLKAIDLVIAAGKLAENKPSTIKEYKGKGVHLLDHFGVDKPIADITPKQTEDYARARLATVKVRNGKKKRPSRHQIQKELRLLVQAGKAADVVGAAKLMPKAFRKQKAFYRPSEEWLTEEDCAALIAEISIGPQTRSCKKGHVAAYLMLGVRQRELYTIRVQDVHLDKGWIWVDGTKTDGSRRAVSLNERSAELLRMKMRGKRRSDPLFENWCSGVRDMKAAAKRAGLPQKVNHLTLRRTYCSHMASNGVSMQHCAQLMGHASIQMVERVYARLCPESLNAAAESGLGLLVPIPLNSHTENQTKSPISAKKRSATRTVFAQ